LKLKLDEQGHVVVQDGKPVYVMEDGRELPHDAASTVATIGRLNGEAKAHREAKEAAEGKLKAFEGIEDGPAALAALATVKNIKDGELITAGKVQEIKDAAAKSARESVEAATRTAAEEKRVLAEQNSQLTQSLNDHVIGNSFASSKFIAEKLAIPADIAQKVFADRLKVENGKLVPMDGNGNPLFSAVRHGEHADFEEAIEVYVSQYPNKDKILKSSGGTGGGAPNGKGDPSNQPKGNLGGTRQERSSAIASRFPELSGGA